ncbi:synapse-associated protein of 47 kDa isoform X1 [Chironomus tepperi]|uniref:synapse-associated protein of 47 kDa isoform X1 n=1 Tax=Chironomus tepperi TaxID=113505 RepID=UPI00391F9B5B
MFSGITNQVSSLSSLFSKHNEENPATATQPVEEGQQPQETAPVIESVENNNVENISGEKQSPTKASGGMFSNVTGKVSGWLPSSLPTVSMPSVSMPTMPTVSMPTMPSIPGLRKSHPADAEALELAPEQAEEAQPSQTANEKDDDDRSSATGGADSRPVSEKGSPTEEQSGAVENVTHKVTAGAKSFGSFLSGVVNKAGDKIKETVKHNPILGEFNKEQEAFIKDQSGKNTEAGVCPWIGHKNEDKIKEEVFSLSSDRRNFVRAPPAGSDFDFNYDTSYPTAVALMAEDPSLEKMRFDLVPKIITEENFWRNYFYRVSLIVQAGELGTLGTDDAFGKREDDDDVTGEKNLKDSSKKDLNYKEKVDSAAYESKAKNDKDVKGIQEKLDITVDKKPFQAEKTSGDEEEWEKNLAAEDFEVVDDQNVDESELDMDLK